MDARVTHSGGTRPSPLVAFGNGISAPERRRAQRRAEGPVAGVRGDGYNQQPQPLDEAASAEPLPDELDAVTPAPLALPATTPPLPVVAAPPLPDASAPPPLLVAPPVPPPVSTVARAAAGRPLLVALRPRRRCSSRLRPHRRCSSRRRPRRRCSSAGPAPPLPMFAVHTPTRRSRRARRPVGGRRVRALPRRSVTHARAVARIGRSADHRDAAHARPHDAGVHRCRCTRRRRRRGSRQRRSGSSIAPSPDAHTPAARHGPAATHVIGFPPVHAPP